MEAIEHLYTVWKFQKIEGKELDTNESINEI